VSSFLAPSGGSHLRGSYLSGVVHDSCSPTLHNTIPIQAVDLLGLISAAVCALSHIMEQASIRGAECPVSHPEYLRAEKWVCGAGVDGGVAGRE
jgi:hypothetical protein